MSKCKSKENTYHEKIKGRIAPTEICSDFQWRSVWYVLGPPGGERRRVLYLERNSPEGALLPLISAIAFCSVSRIYTWVDGHVFPSAGEEGAFDPGIRTPFVLFLCNYASNDSSLALIGLNTKPVAFQTTPQKHASPIKHDPTVCRGNIKNLTDFFGA